MDKLNWTYDNLALLGDFNVEPEDESISEFLNLYNLRYLVKQNTCFKNPDKPRCIDLTNCAHSFQNTDTFKTGQSGFHKVTFTVLKQHFPKQKSRLVIQPQYKSLFNNYFRIELENVLLKYDFNNIAHDNFIKTCFGQACSKEKIFKGESRQFCDKTVKKGYNEKIKIT